jgi:hypothetical protein
MANPTTAQKVSFSIQPKDAAGNTVDLVAFPSALSTPVYTVDKADAVLVVTATGADLTSPTAGTAIVTVTATNVSGTVLTDTSTVVFELPIPVVATLGLTQAAPV